MSTLILGDVHLGKGVLLGRPGIGTTLNSRIIDQCDLLDFVLERALENAVEEIIITGDIFEEQKPHPTLISLFISWLNKCSDNNVRVIIIVGNHDIIRSGQFQTSALDIVSTADIDGVSVINRLSTIHRRGVSYTLVPFVDRRSMNLDSNSEAIRTLSDKISYELAEIDDYQYKVVIGHLAIEGSLPIGDEIDDMVNELYCPLKMFNGYDYVWMGHIHKPQILQKTRPHIAHIGSMDISNFGETEHTKFFIIFNPENTIPYKAYELPTRTLKQISISVPNNITDTTAYVIEKLSEMRSLDKAIVRLNVNLSNSTMISIDRMVIEEKLNSMGAFHIARISEERKVSPIANNTENNLDNTVNEITAIKMYAISNIEEKSRNQFISLANTIVEEHYSEN